MDVRLRAFDRAAASDDLQALARRLVERVRAGALTQDRLDLAAYLHDPAASLVAPHVHAPTDVVEWLATLGEVRGLPLVLWIMVGVLMDRVEAGASSVPEDHARDLAASVHAWVLDPTPERNGWVRWAALALFRARGSIDVVHPVLYLTSAWSVDRRPDRVELAPVVAPLLGALGVERVDDLRPRRFVPWALSGPTTGRGP